MFYKIFQLLKINESDGSNKTYYTLVLNTNMAKYDTERFYVICPEAQR